MSGKSERVSVDTSRANDPDSAVESKSPTSSPQGDFLRGWKILDNVNKDLLVSKLAFFFFFMAMGAFLPFLGVFYKQLWLNARQTGILLGIRPFIKMLCSPLWGMVTDVCNKPKWILLVSILGAIIAHVSQSVVSPFTLPCYPETNGTIDGFNYSNPIHPSVLGDEPVIKTRRRSGLPPIRTALDLDKTDIELTLNHNEVFDVSEGERVRHTANSDNGEERKLYNHDEKVGKITESDDGRDGRKYYKDKDKTAHSGDRRLSTKRNHQQKDGAAKSDVNADDHPPEITSNRDSKAAHTSSHPPQSAVKSAKAKEIQKKDNNKPFITKSMKRVKPLDPYNDFRFLGNQRIFVTLMVIVILGEFVSAPAPMLTDSGTLDLLSGREWYYGRQRMFGSIGWGVGSLLSGAVVAALNTCPYSDAMNYVTCFYVFAAAMFFDFITCLFFKFKKCERPTGDVRSDKGFLNGLKIFATFKNSGFILTLFFLGYSHSLQLSFLFWFLQDIGGTPLLFALILAVNATSEVLVFFVATNLVQKLGNDTVIYIGLGCYGIRFLLYSYLENPWFVLPVEALQGFTYGGVWTASVSYMGSQPGSGATVQGILHGVYWGLGMAIGGVLGGFMLHGIGARLTFQIEAACSFAILVLFFGINNIDQRRDTYTELPAEPGNETEDDE